jgi:hypothetical protein
VAAGRLGVRIDAATSNRSVFLVIEPAAEPDPLEARLRELLNLDPARQEFRLVYTLRATGPGAIPLRTRTLIEVLGQLATGIAVPPDDVTDGRTYGTIASPGGRRAAARIDIRQGLLRPRDALVEVEYAGRWYWVDDKDLGSTRVFTFVMLLLSLAESTQAGQPPVITIPAG